MIRSKPWPLIGYAPGDYLCRCSICDEGFTGDKRAIHCLDCAAARANDLLSASVPLGGEGDGSANASRAAMGPVAHLAPEAEPPAAKRTMTITLTDAEMVAMEQMIAQTAMQPRTIFRHALAAYQLNLHQAVFGPIRDDRLPPPLPEPPK